LLHAAGEETGATGAKRVHARHAKKVREKLVALGYSLQYGARFLKRVIDEQIKLPISERWKEASNFEVIVRDGRLAVDAPGTPVRLANSAVA
jgi:ATP-dependent Clp protease ATP-binding subunit ClpA